MGTPKLTRHRVFVFLVTSYICFMPVSSNNNKNCKPGRCPVFEAGRACPEPFDIHDSCFSDFECPGKTKCCSDGCELKCMPPSSDKTPAKPNDIKQYCKPGECPSVRIGENCPNFWELQDECYLDYQCPREQKCCSDGCELKCMNVAKANISAEVLTREYPVTTEPPVATSQTTTTIVDTDANDTYVNGKDRTPAVTQVEIIVTGDVSSPPSSTLVTPSDVITELTTEMRTGKAATSVTKEASSSEYPPTTESTSTDVSSREAFSRTTSSTETSSAEILSSEAASPSSKPSSTEASSSESMRSSSSEVPVTEVSSNGASSVEPSSPSNTSTSTSTKQASSEEDSSTPTPFSETTTEASSSESPPSVETTSTEASSSPSTSRSTEVSSVETLSSEATSRSSEETSTEASPSTSPSSSSSGAPSSTTAASSVEPPSPSASSSLAPSKKTSPEQVSSTASPFTGTAAPDSDRPVVDPEETTATPEVIETSSTPKTTTEASSSESPPSVETTSTEASSSPSTSRSTEVSSVETLSSEATSRSSEETSTEASPSTSPSSSSSGAPSSTTAASSVEPPSPSASSSLAPSKKTSPEQVSSTASPFTGVIKVYYLNVTVVNRYGEDVIVLTELQEPYKRINLPVDSSYKIETTVSDFQLFVITAFDASTYIPLKINDKATASVLPRNTPDDQLILYIEEAPSTKPSPSEETAPVTTAPSSTSPSTDASSTNVPSPKSPVYYISINVVNNYGNNVEVRSSMDSISSFIVRNGENVSVRETTDSKAFVVIRVFDERDGIPIAVNGKMFARLTPTDFPEFVYTIYLEPGKVRFYIVFVVVNNYKNEVLVSTTLPGPSQSFKMKPGETVVVSKQPSTRDPVIVNATDAITGRIINVGGQPLVRLIPSENFGSFKVLYIDRVVPVPVFPTTVYYIVFIITNTYGKDIILTTNLYNPFDKIGVLNGQTVLLTIRVATKNDVTIGAVERGTDKLVQINGRDVFLMTPEEQPGRATVLSVPDSAAFPSTGLSTEASLTETISTTTSAVETTGPFTTVQPPVYYIVLRVVNNHSGAVRLKSNLAAPSDYFKISPREVFTKTFELSSQNPVAFGAYDVITSKSLLVNGSRVVVVTPAKTKEILTIINVTEEETTVLSTTPITTTGCFTNSGEKLRIGEEYSEDNCSQICTCTLRGIECRTLCPMKTLDLLDCKSPYILKFSVVPADPLSLGCFCTRIDCILTELTTTPSMTTLRRTTPPLFGEPPAIKINTKQRDEVPKRKIRYKSAVGALIIARPNVAVTIVCQASGIPKPIITWSINSIPAVPSKVIRILSGGRIRIKSLSDKYVGIYQCNATNAYGMDTAISKVTVYDDVSSTTPSVSPFYSVPIEFSNKLNSEVIIRTSLPEPYDSIILQPNQVFTSTLRSASTNRVTINAEEKETNKKVAVNGKGTIYLIPQETPSQLYSVEITEGEPPRGYYINIKVTNKYRKLVELKTTMNPPNDIFDINAGAILTLEIKTNSRNPITYRVYDKETRVPVPINGKMSVSLTPKDSKNVVDELVIEQDAGLPEKYYLLLNVKNNYDGEITLFSTLKGRYKSVKIRAREKFGLTINTTDSSSVTFKAFEKDGSPALINGEIEVTVTPRVDRDRSTTLNIDAESPVLYYLQFKVINNYEEDIMVKTTLGSPYDSQQIRSRDSFTLTTQTFKSDTVDIRAIVKRTNRPITLNGMQSFSITPQRTRGQVLILGAPNLIEVSEKLVYIITFELQNTAGIALLLQSTQLPARYQNIYLQPDETLRLNVTVQSPAPVEIKVYDAETNKSTTIGGKATFIILPRVISVIEELPVVATYKLRFSIENKYDQDIYIRSNLRKPYDYIRILGRQTLRFDLNTSSPERIQLKAYDFQSSEQLRINDQFKQELLPQTGYPKEVVLAVPFAEYKLYYVVLRLINNYGKNVIVRSSLDPPHDSIPVLAGLSTKMTIPTAKSNAIVFTVIDATTGKRLEINRKPSVLLEPKLSQVAPEELYIPTKDIFYVAFSLKNKFGKDIILQTSMPQPYDSISIPKNQEIKRTIVLYQGDPVRISAIDAFTKENVTIDGKEYITIEPSRKPIMPVPYNVPSEGPYYISFNITNLYRKRIVVQMSLKQPESPIVVNPGEVYQESIEVSKSDSVTFRVYDAQTLDPVTINGKNQIDLVPTKAKFNATILSVPYAGCPIPNKNLLRVGEQYVDDECTRLCTCTEKSGFACVPLCATTPGYQCVPPLVSQVTFAPAGPAGSRCICQQTVCVIPEGTTSTTEKPSTVIPETATNYALLGSTSQSSTAWGGYSFQGVDGDRNTNFLSFSCTHTMEEDNPWWSVSLGPTPVNVSAIRITNRGDCCGDRLSNFEIRIGDYFGEESVKSAKCGNLHTINGISKVITCPENLVGKYVTIRIPGKNKILALCEVEVYGTRLERTE